MVIKQQEAKQKGKEKKRKPWPKGCIWPEPLWNGKGGISWDEDIVPMSIDEDTQYMIDIKEYYDQLVEEGRLDDEYRLNDEYDIFEDECNSEDQDPEEEWTPDEGEDYWNGEQFMADLWEEDLSSHLNLLKINADKLDSDPAFAIRQIIEYDFINENLLRQAFTRRAFQIEYGLAGCNEELEFLGDTVLGTVVTREIMEHLTWVMTTRTDAPFEVKKWYAEGELTRLKTHFISKEFLSERAAELGLDRYILYGTGEEPTDSSREDMLEALIGAVTIDCSWNWDVIDGVVDKLLCMQLSHPDEYLKKTHYDLFNAWHQSRFGCIPEYELYENKSRKHSMERFACTIRFQVPENDQGLRTAQRIDVEAPTRSRARERAAEYAYRFVMKKGLWINLADAHLKPDQDNSINQLQELYQKKYVEQPVYEFSEDYGDKWRCDCRCSDVSGYGVAGSKTAAKKKAAFMVLVFLLDAAGCCKEEWMSQMFRSITE